MFMQLTTLLEAMQQKTDTGFRQIPYSDFRKLVKVVDPKLDIFCKSEEQSSLGTSAIELVVDGAVAGAIALHKMPAKDFDATEWLPDNTNVVEFVDILTLPRFRGKGLALKLLQHVQKNGNTLLYCADASNTKSIAVAKRAGFKELDPLELTTASEGFMEELNHLRWFIYVS